MKKTDWSGEILLAFLALSTAGWITHIVVCIKAKAWLFLIACSMMAPLGVIHGWSSWLGYSWVN